MAAIASELPALGAHLERAVKTGTFCSYRPAPEPAFAVAERSSISTAGPTGIVTFLLTDIEGSTRLWEDHPKEMATALAEHDSMIANAVGRHDGRLLKTKGEGDSTFSVFARATDAVACAVDVQLAAASLSMPLRVRMALHSGEADERDGEYFGGAVNRCARLREAAHGRQVLLSASVAELVRDRLSDETSLGDLGPHHLRDLDRPEHVFQLLHPDLESDFPPLCAPDWRPNNLPVQLTTFVGRTDELARIRELLEDRRLVTLTGAGGSGKTRLAVEAAAQQLDRWSDGAWLVDLAPLLDEDNVARAIADALGVKESPLRPVMEDVTARISTGRVLILLDNCEHLVEGCARVVDVVLRACPEVRVLATSREPLGVGGEVTFRIDSLDLPTEGANLAAIAEAEAVRLFAERARSCLPDFVIDADVSGPVAYICRRLDGLPLALELAAARLTMFSVHDLASNLESSFKLLSGGLRTALPRHRTLEATVGWSYDLLTERRRALFDRLSVFSGGFSLDAAVEVFGCMGWEADTVLEDLESLINKSLVVRDELPGGRVRYRLLETLRQYAGTRLVQCGDVPTARDAHLRWMTRVAADADAALDGPDAKRHLDLLEQEIDNLRAALEWSIASDRLEEGFELATPGFGAFWLWRSHLREARVWMDRLLARASRPTRLHARTVLCASRLAFQSGSWETGEILAERSRDMYRDIGDDAGEARSLIYIAINCWASDTSGRIGPILEEALELASRAGEREELALAHGLLGLSLVSTDVQRARRHTEEAVRVAEAAKSLNWMAHMREYRAYVGLFEGDLDAARLMLRAAIPLYGDVGNRSCGSHCVETVAAYLADRGDLDGAAELLGAMEAAREEVGSVPPPYERLGYERGLEAVRTGLDATALEAAWARGRALSYDEATARALEHLPAIEGQERETRAG